MRNLGEMRRRLQHLRFVEGIPLAQIAKDASCSVPQIIACLKAEASETIWRRVDAYLDAKHLHKSDKETKRSARIARLGREMWERYHMMTIPARDVLKMSTDKQMRLENGMHNRLKKMLRVEIAQKMGKMPWFSDGDNYWRCKIKMLKRYPDIPMYGDSGIREKDTPYKPRFQASPRA